MMEFVYAYAYFVLYAFLGWVCEDLYCGIPAKKFINRGFFYGPYCPIYGVGALLVLLDNYQSALVYYQKYRPDEKAKIAQIRNMINGCAEKIDNR